jgi:hypothetical protein
MVNALVLAAVTKAALAGGMVKGSAGGGHDGPVLALGQPVTIGK